MGLRKKLRAAVDAAVSRATEDAKAALDVEPGVGAPVEVPYEKCLPLVRSYVLKEKVRNALADEIIAHRRKEKGLLEKLEALERQTAEELEQLKADMGLDEETAYEFNMPPAQDAPGTFIQISS